MKSAAAHHCAHALCLLCMQAVPMPQWTVESKLPRPWCALASAFVGLTEVLSGIICSV